jgi:pimeloyl-ACP methyl ester carboxylesterase
MATMNVPSPYAALLDQIPVSTHSLTVCNSETRYWEYGDARTGAGTPDGTTLVLVHGFRGDHHGLEAVVAQLAGLHIISPDLPGFGESASFGAAATFASGERVRHDIPGYVQWLHDFIGALALPGRVVVLGHSFGSIIVAAAAADGLATRDIVLVNPIAAPALSGPRGVLTRLAVFYYRAAALLPERAGFALLRNRLIVRVMSVSMAKTRNRELRRWIHNQHDRFFSAFSDRSVVLEAFRASVSADVSQYASRISARTLLIAADKDDITPVAAQYRLQALLPNARLTVIQGVGHLIHYEVPTEAAAAVTDFLAPGSSS